MILNIRRLWIATLGFIPLMTFAVGPNSKIALIPPIVMVMGLWLLSSFPRIKFKTFPKLLLFILFLGIFSPVSSLFVHNSMEDARYMAGKISILILVIMAYTEIRNERDFIYFARFYVIAFLGLILLTILNAFGIIHLEVMDRVAGRQMFSFLPNRALGLFMSYGEHGMLMAMCFGVIIYAAVMQWWRSNLLILFCFAMLILQLLLTQSRATFLGFFVMIIVFFLASMWRRFLSKKYDSLWKFASVCMLGFLAFGVDWLEFYDYMYNIQSGNVDGRFEVNAIAMQLFLEHPLYGVGYSDATHSIGRVLGDDVGIHNFWVLEFTAAGVFFGALAVFYYVYLAWQILQGSVSSHSRREYVFWVVIGSVFMWDIVMLNFFSGTFVEIFCVLVAIIVRAREPGFFVETPYARLAGHGQKYVDPWPQPGQSVGVSRG